MPVVRLERRRHALHAPVLELHLTGEGTRRPADAEVVVADLDRGVVDLLGPDAAERLRELLEVLATPDALTPIGQRSR